MIRAGGVAFISEDTKRLFLLLRSKTSSNPLTWGFPGGKIEDKETIMSGISRELREELGAVPEYIKSVPIDIFNSNDNKFSYYSFVVIVKNEFIPTINSESAGYGWFNLNSLPKPIHPGTKSLILGNDFKRIVREILSDVSK